MEALKENQDPQIAAASKPEQTTAASKEVPLKQDPAKESPEEEPDEEEKLSPVEQKLQAKIKAILEEYYLTPFQTVACQKFLREKVGNPNDHSVDRLRSWLFMRMNGKQLPPKYHERQLGCPDLVPGMSIRGFWDPTDIPFVSELEKNYEVIRAELMDLREKGGF